MNAIGITWLILYICYITYSAKFAMRDGPTAFMLWNHIVAK